MTKKRDLGKIREDIKKYEEKKREAEEQLRALNAQRIDSENDEIVATIRAMTEKGGDVMQTLHNLTAKVHAQPRPYIPNKSNESEVSIDD